MGILGNKVLLFALVQEDLLMPTSSGIQTFRGEKERVCLTKYIL